ncbi:hypothetical protein E4191_17545 (plasmid) [Paracoccus liaowanqingii]|uniref:Uncharacterized protein n=1 Tax=Paracoccus liaowanqingii TaxID=2560053 RepID=A0A4Y5SR10_9RHOB|nr:hypothetical protein [Paracoccus liaowanqingii]QDA35942.1 hypothetical protein E4191_17545 [Paracoccus liaowanqingii]
MFPITESNNVAKVEITRDMLEAILLIFASLGDICILEIEVRHNGLFVLNPLTGKYEVIGLASMPPSMNHLS